MWWRVRVELLVGASSLASRYNNHLFRGTNSEDSMKIIGGGEGGTNDAFGRWSLIFPALGKEIREKSCLKR